MASLTEEKVAELVKIIQTAKDADTGKSTDGEAVNVLHVAVTEVSIVSYDTLKFLPNLWPTL